jgi:hypothetical protein
MRRHTENNQINSEFRQLPKNPMKTDTLRFRELLQKDIRLVVPLFQRPYVWNQKDQWEPLWEDIRNLAESILNDRFRRPHFLGAIVLEQVKTGAGEVDQRLVIDGQQRLTTAQLILEAFHDLCHELGADKAQAALAKMTRIDDPMADEGGMLFKVWPTTVDQPAFRIVMEAGTAGEVLAAMEADPSLESRPIVQGYLYFSETIREWLQLEGSMEKRITALLNALRDNMRFVVIDLEDEDDAQLIFETLNARGTPLLPTDLVKNFVFHRARLEQIKLQPLYEKYWASFDEWDEWWRKQIGRGHAQRARIDLFLQSFLTVQTREEVPVTHVYAVCRDHIIKSNITSEAFLRNLHEAANIYGSFESYESNTPEGRFFRTVDVMDVTSVMPVALELFSRFGDQPKVLRPVLADIESFLIRRMICGLNTRGYNRFFLDLLGQIKSADTLQERVRKFLLKSEADSSRWPKDPEFRAAWLSAPIYRTLVRKRVRFILETLETSLHDSKTEEIVSKLHIEHLLPQSWKQHWPLPGIGDPEEEASARDQLLHSIGNLTLVTKSLNPALSNASWTKKIKEIRKYGALSLNREVAEENEWNEDRIDARARNLFKTARKVWSHPG